ncbi:helix-turn-helix domain-containing protein [Streptomyces jumonjinensis]|uniref:Helix-turn-helix domain-containing protein n=1 Tax=Streptomyces jumonjinensis TaxID=1945 RepID=A0A646KBB4_STRJU|nr:helix-turn-helix domain-containing protein [Streptomyces jumonjinensis]
MELNNEDPGKPTPRTVLGRRLQRLRTEGELSQRGLAERVKYPHTYLSRVERGEQLPSEGLAEALDAYFGTLGLFAELLELAQHSTIPDYGQKIVENEEKAARIQVFDSSVVPGLLQTEDYARALIRISLPGVSADDIEERVAIRMRRRRIFEKQDKPLYWAIMDEAAIKRPVGGVGCMMGQVGHILKAVEASHISVQVLPFTRGEHSLMGGCLYLLTLENGATIGYAESFASGELVEAPRRLLQLTQRFDEARSQALPKDETLDLLHSYLKGYEDDDDS